MWGTVCLVKDADGTMQTYRMSPNQWNDTVSNWETKENEILKALKALPVSSYENVLGHQDTETGDAVEWMDAFYCDSYPTHEHCTAF